MTTTAAEDERGMSVVLPPVGEEEQEISLQLMVEDNRPSSSSKSDSSLLSDTRDDQIDHPPPPSPEERYPREFTLTELDDAIEYLSDEWSPSDDSERPHVMVRRGFLWELHRNVVVERAPMPTPSTNLFRPNPEITARLQHENMVQLFGWCQDQESGSFYVVHELMSNGTLYSHLHPPAVEEEATAAASLLSSDLRYKIACGLVSAIYYLDSQAAATHLQIDSRNIFLDSDFNAKLTNYGAGAWATQPGQAWIMGTSMRKPGHATSAVHRLGIVTLEIATGLKETGCPRGLWKYTRGFLAGGAVTGAVDRRLGIDSEREKMERLLLVGLLCAQPTKKHRPPVGQVLDYLHFKASLPSPLLPPHPQEALIHELKPATDASVAPPFDVGIPRDYSAAGSMKDFEIHVMKGVVAGLHQSLQGGLGLEGCLGFVRKYTRVLVAMGVPLRKWEVLVQEVLRDVKAVEELREELGEEEEGEVGSGSYLAALEEDLGHIDRDIGEEDERMRELGEKLEVWESRRKQLRRRVAEVQRQAVDAEEKCRSIEEDLAAAAERKAKEEARRERKRKEHYMLGLSHSILSKVASFSLDD